MFLGDNFKRHLPLRAPEASRDFPAALREKIPGQTAVAEARLPPGDAWRKRVMVFFSGEFVVLTLVVSTFSETTKSSKAFEKSFGLLFCDFLCISFPLCCTNAHNARFTVSEDVARHAQSDLRKSFRDSCMTSGH